MVIEPNFTEGDRGQPAQAIEGVIFDCDGVLVDSRQANVATYQNLLVLGGYDKPAEEAILNCFHLPVTESLAHLTGSRKKEELTRLESLLEAPGVRDPSLFIFPDELKEVLARLKTRYKLGIATSRSRLGMEDVFTASNIRSFFSAIVTREEYAQRKPHPEALLLATHQLGIAACRAIYVGDSPSDMEAAKRAGMRSIYLSSDGHPYADSHVVTLSELPAALLRFGN